MLDQPNAAGQSPVPIQDDLRAQVAVLRHVLDSFPERLTIPGLVSELTKGALTFSKGDALERAILDLTGIGLLQCPCGMVEPTRAAMRFNELAEV